MELMTFDLSSGDLYGLYHFSCETGNGISIWYHTYFESGSLCQLFNTINPILIFPSALTSLKNIVKNS